MKPVADGCILVGYVSSDRERSMKDTVPDSQLFHGFSFSLLLNYLHCNPSHLTNYTKLVKGTKHGVEQSMNE